MKEGIIVNPKEYRIYFFYEKEGKTYVKTYPIGIGREGYATPRGEYHVMFKIKDPVWKPPDHIRAEKPELPALVPPGPDNPLGGYWIQFANSYGMHGTLKPPGVGRRVSSGSMRLYTEDAADLFQIVKPGNIVKIVDMPVKLAVLNDKIYIELHYVNTTDNTAIDHEDEDEEGSEAKDDEKRYSDSEMMDMVMTKVREKNLEEYVSREKISAAIKERTGLPTLISDTQ
ncbi:ErfK/YbiS/YcfS/YnhG family protein [Candidatus Omnitrophus magneticus]|uniref:ErfK/YbiS/YcfS/YnhG family protein n=1 Tax=Candidatus Omnitrophus magneticus TaxID=1609969 RepID=A0A0F0CPB2_9BACT|nr:ErfK/YbiS/YcfS/YnhG family protein [Candidatus Omnitrophus magneticus]